MRPGETPVFFFEAGLGSLNSKGGRIWLFFGGGGQLKEAFYRLGVQISFSNAKQPETVFLTFGR